MNYVGATSTPVNPTAVAADDLGSVIFTPTVKGVYTLVVWNESSRAIGAATGTGQAGMTMSAESALSGAESFQVFTINVSAGVSTVTLTAQNSTAAVSGANGSLIKVSLKDAAGNASILAPGETITLTPSGSGDIAYVNGVAVTSAAGASYNLSSASFNASGTTGAGTYNIVSQTNFQIRNSSGTQVFVMDTSGNLTMTGNITGGYVFGSYFNSSAGNSENPTIGQVWTQSTGDNYLRKSTPAHLISQLGLITSSNIGSQTVATATTANSLAANTSPTIQVLNFTGVGGNSGNANQSYAIYQEGGAWGSPFPDLCIGYHTGIKLGANGPSYEGTRVYTDYDMSDLAIQLCGPSNYSFKYKWMWTNDTGYYSSVNSAHWYPNNITYGQWRMDGNRNGWYGHVIDSAYLPHYMWESGNGGIYLQNAGRWVLYHSLGNNCTGMGTSATAGGYAIYCNGGVYATGNIVAYSDIRKKKDVVTVDNALDKILELRGVYYTKIYNEHDTIPDGGADKRQLGVVAQEVNEVVPEVVSYTEHLDEYAVAYGNFAGLFIEGFKEQQIIINKQADEINLLKEELQKIKDLILNINKE